MDGFLRQVAARILREFPKDTDKVLVVFNNHRSELFLRHAFEQMSKGDDETVVKPFFLPQITTIDEMVGELGGMKLLPNEFLLFELYRVHVEIGGEERKYRTFEEFMSFGDIMLSDFSEIDRYCVDAKDLFVNLHNLKAIGEWDVSDPHLSPLQSSYLEFYHSLYRYYERLRANLEQRGEAYGGMAYRKVAENIATLANGCRWKHIYFVGFNALSECERRIIGEYVRRGIGTLLTDGDTYYYDDTMQEAGRFLRKHGDEFPTIKPSGPSLFAQKEKKITIVECPEAVLQCKYAGQLLAQNSDWLGDSESTAIVLADESLLMPTLAALPEVESGKLKTENGERRTETPEGVAGTAEIERSEEQRTASNGERRTESLARGVEDSAPRGVDYGVNVSMGFSYADSAAHVMVMHLLDMYRSARADGYYHAHVVQLLSDYHIGALLQRKDMRRVASAFLERENRIRCSAADIVAMMGSGELAFLFPAEVPGVDATIAIMRQLAEKLVQSGAIENNKKEKQALGCMIEVVEYLEQMQKEYGFLADVLTLQRIYQRIAQRRIIAFLGQPLSGLQVMGVLETRNLDFRRVILLSANEGVIPAGRKDNSLIPFELQRVFGLPTYEEKDSVYAYNIYRLLQRAEEVYVCYSSSTEGTGKGEESRFVKQIRSELARRYPETIHVSDAVVDLKATPFVGSAPTAWPKSAAIMERLAEMAAYGFSPSSLTNYVRCPLRFYYENVLKVKKRDELEDDLDASQLGSCVHSILEGIYKPYLGRTVEAEALKEAQEKLPQLVADAFAKYYVHGRDITGRNHMMSSVATTQIRRLLERERSLIEKGNRIEIVALEEEVIMPLREGVNLKGIVDRIDRMNGKLRIIDYKTGSLDQKEIALKSEQVDEGKLPAKWLQLMTYALIYCHSHAGETHVQAGIYPLRNLRSDVQLASLDGQDDLTPGMVAIVDDTLRRLVEELMNPDVPFAATDNEKGCAYCPVEEFCGGFAIKSPF